MRAIVIAATCFAALVSLAVGDERPFVGPPVPPAELKVVSTIDVPGLMAGLYFSPSGKVLAGSVDQSIRFWEPRTGKESQKSWQLDSPMSLLGFADEKTLVLGNLGNSAPLQLRTYPSGKEIARLDNGKETIRDVAVSEGLVAITSTAQPEDRFKISDLRVRVWAGAGKEWAERWKANPPIRPIGKNGDYLHSLSVAPDRQVLAVGSKNGWAYVYRTKDGKLLRSVAPEKLGGERPVVTFAPNGRDVAVTFGLCIDNNSTCRLSLGDADLAAARVRPQWLQDRPYRAAFTPDGKTLIVPCEEGMVRFYETETGGLRHVGTVSAEPSDLTLSPDGRVFAVSDAVKPRVLLIDWLATAGKSGASDAAALERLWTDLASPSSATGYRALVALVSTPTSAAKLIGDKLKPAAAPNAESVKRWVADLGADDFATREAAEKELAKLGDAAEAELRVAAKSDMPERRDRATKLVKALSRRDTPERLRILRAVEVLEYADTPAGRAVLKTLASGAPSALLTRDAKAALARLQAFDPKP